MSIRTFHSRFEGDQPFSPENRLRIKINQLEELASLALVDRDMADYHRKQAEAQRLREKL